MPNPDPDPPGPLSWPGGPPKTTPTGRLRGCGLSSAAGAPVNPLTATWVGDAGLIVAFGPGVPPPGKRPFADPASAEPMPSGDPRPPGPVPVPRTTGSMPALTFGTNVVPRPPGPGPLPWATAALPVIPELPLPYSP